MKMLYRLMAASLLAVACRSSANPNPTIPDDTGIGLDASTTDTGNVGPSTDTGTSQPTDSRVQGDCTTSGPENTNAACGDGVDNDCDGFTDCRDFDCTRTSSVTICPATDGGSRACDATGPENTNAACSDGVDNDCDGFRDCSDFDCSRGNAVTICPRDGGSSRCDATGDEDTNATCGDGIDNDCDGFTDCADFSCRNCSITACVTNGGIALRDGGVCMCQGSENTDTACGDHVDNDCNGFVDCADFSCSRTASVTVCPRDGGTTPRCDASGAENTNATCGDGIDNDCDGHTDCEDFSCRSCAITACVHSGSITLRDGGTCMCQGTENTNAACGDGVDNDCDGFVDCRDFDCTAGDAGVSVCRDGG